MTASYKVFVQLVSPVGVLTQVDATPMNWKRPTTGWITGEVIEDRYVLSIPTNAPQGTYSLIVGMYDEETLQRLPVLDASGAATDDHITLGSVVVD